MISVQKLVERYGSNVVDSLSFEVDKGEVVGFLGPNGAGRGDALHPRLQGRAHIRDRTLRPRKAHTVPSRRRSAARPQFRYAPGGGDHLRFGHVVRLGTIDAIRLRVLAQAGIAVLPEYLVRKDVASGRLVTILPGVLALKAPRCNRSAHGRRTTPRSIASGQR